MLILWRRSRVSRGLNSLSVPSGSFTYKLPDNMDTMEGALVEPAAVGMHARQCWRMLLDRVKKIVVGAGCIGLMTLQACESVWGDQYRGSGCVVGKTAGNG